MGTELFGANDSLTQLVTAIRQRFAEQMPEALVNDTFEPHITVAKMRWGRKHKKASNVPEPIIEVVEDSILKPVAPLKSAKKFSVAAMDTFMQEPFCGGVFQPAYVELCRMQGRKGGEPYSVLTKIALRAQDKRS